MKNIEDIYPLSPLQQGLLFETLYAAQSARYVEHVGWRMDGELDLPTFERAWQTLIDRHAILRSAFIWELVEQPLQVVRKRAQLSWEHFDWRKASPELQKRQLKEYVDADGRRGFGLTRAPLMRCAIIQAAEDSYEFIWAYHHLLLDGWSVMLLLRELILVYEAMVGGSEPRLEECRPFRNYILWLQRQDLGEAERYWRRVLAGFRAPTRLLADRGPAGSPAQENDYETERAELTEEGTAELQAIARQQQLTLNSLVFGAWALTLSHRSGNDDIVVGTVVSGRPPSLSAVEMMVGLFINTLPVRVQVAEEAELLEWLRQLQMDLADMREREYSPLAKVQAWSEVPRGQPLFETLFNLQNMPVERFLREGPNNLQILDITRYDSRNSSAITFLVTPGKRLSLVIKYDRRRFDHLDMSRMLASFQALITSFSTHLGSPLRVLTQMLRESEKGAQTQKQEKREAVSFDRFKKVKPRVVSLAKDQLVSMDLQPGATVPLVITPKAEGLDLVDWAAGSPDLIETKLSKHGALLFRGFNVNSATRFEQVAAAIYPDLFGDYGDLPREEVGGKVYGSTPYPSDQAILFHNESSHMHKWPMKIWFHCVTAAEQGGETPIVDCRRVYELLDPKIKKRFEEKNILYVRNYVSGLDVSWQQFFRTSDRARVEEFCTNARIDFEWKSDDRLTTRRVCRAAVSHPKTRERVFFNQIQLHHVSCLERGARDSLQTVFREEEFPRNVYFGDGSAIEDSIVDEIRELFQNIAVPFPWQKGDILMLDNMLVAHGRNPYSGPRKIVVAMGEMIGSEKFEGE